MIRFSLVDRVSLLAELSSQVSLVISKRGSMGKPQKNKCGLSDDRTSWTASQYGHRWNQHTGRATETVNIKGLCYKFDLDMTWTRPVEIDLLQEMTFVAWRIFSSRYSSRSIPTATAPQLVENYTLVPTSWVTNAKRNRNRAGVWLRDEWWFCTRANRKLRATALLPCQR